MENRPSNHSQVSVAVILPPGPIGPGLNSPSVCQVPTKYPRRACPGTGRGAAGCSASARGPLERRTQKRRRGRPLFTAHTA